jgi:protein RecA
MARRRTTSKVSEQVKASAEKGAAEKQKPKKEEERPPLVSTGSTLLDLAISGGRWRGGGVPPGILVEIFGPASAGKTVILCELAGAVRRAGGDIMFRDPEARLNKEFAKLFDLQVDEIDYAIPSTIPEVFEPVQNWEADDSKIRAAFADSLAALTTDMELEGKDQYGGRRAKEFSEQCRLTTRSLAQNNTLMVCSNQVRQNLDAGPWGQKYKSPGGESIGFYASLRLRAKGSQKLTKKKKIKGKDVSRTIGTQTDFEVFKSSIWKPYRTATVYIIHDYGIDDIRANLEFVKQTKGDSRFKIGDTDLGQGMEAAIDKVEEEELEEDLRDEVIDLWEELESKFTHERKRKKRE